MPTPKVTSKMKVSSARKRASRGLTFRLTVVVEPDGDEFYAYCPALPGVLMPGATVEEALQNARDAIIACLETMIEYGDPIPVGLQLSADDKRQNERWPRKTKGVYQESLVVCLE